MLFLHKNIFSVNPQPFGLDLSDLSLKAVFFDIYGNTDVLSGFSSVALPSGAVFDGEILKENAVISAVRKLLEKSAPCKIAANQVVCSLPETKVFLRIISLPVMKEDDAKEFIKLEIEKNIPLALEQVYYDSQIVTRNLSGEKNKMSVLVVAVAKTTVDQLVRILEMAGLEVVALETESIAQARSLLSTEENNKTTLVIDICDRQTNFMMAIGNIPCFSSSISFSSQIMTDVISKSMHISLKEAVSVRHAYGIGSFMKRDPLFNIIQSTIESLIIGIEKSIRFYLNDLRYSSAVDSIVLCGGGSNMVGLAPYLAQRLNIPVDIGNPWTNVRLGNRLPLIENKQAAQYSTAIGLALRNRQKYEN
jgi:type IV pilus assembly protein PilM